MSVRAHWDHTAVLVQSRRTFVDWVLETELKKSGASIDVERETHVYLADPFEPEDFDAWLTTHATDIFEDQLSSWFPDPADWPADRGLDALRSYFVVALPPSLREISSGS